MNILSAQKPFTYDPKEFEFHNGKSNLVFSYLKIACLSTFIQILSTVTILFLPCQRCNKTFLLGKMLSFLMINHGNVQF